MFAAVAGILLLVGLWTPVAGTMITIAELWIVCSSAGGPGIPRPPELEQTIHSSTIVIIVPTTGVHKPARSSIPATAANMCGTIDANCDVSLKCAIP